MGKLYLVATPIGNLGDITLRALETLKGADYILCEDTRVTGKLFAKYVVSKKLISFNEHSEERKTPEVLADLNSGKSIALVSDAGTPLISDPGYKLVRSAMQQGIRVESIPGPSSVITALTLSGLPPDKFTFIGYLPKSEGKREKILQAVKGNQENLKSTTIFFESPFRVVKTLKSIKKVFGNIEVVITRELTKIHEEVRKESVSKLIEHFEEIKPKGEFVILF